MNRSQVRVIDPVLSAVAHGYRNARFVGLSLMPTVSCPKSGIALMKFGKEAFIKYNMRRSPGSEVQTVQFGYASEPVALVQDSLSGKVPREWLRDSQDIPGVDHGKTAVKNVMSSLQLGLEYEIAALATDASNYGTNNKIALSGSDKWTDPNSKLKQSVDAYKEAVRTQIGVKPNTMVLTPGDYNACKNHPEVKEQFKYTSSSSITVDMLRGFFELDTLEVADSIWTPDADGDMQDIWQHSVMGYVPPVGERSMGVPSYGYTYELEGHPMVEESYYEKSIKSFLYPVEYERRPYLTGMNAGFLIQNAS